MGRRAVFVFCVVLACGGRRRPLPLGQALSRLPHAGPGSLLSEVPAPVEWVAALRSPEEARRWIESSRLSMRLRALGIARSSPTLPWVERWRAVRQRLSRLARAPLPGLPALLSGSAVFVRTADGFLWISRLGARDSALISFARVLNAVHPSGREVEIEEHHGISIRKVRAGPGLDLRYYVLADRLAIATDRGLLERSLDLALGGEGAAAEGQPVFQGLEEEAERVGFAIALSRDAFSAGGGTPFFLPGIRWARLAGGPVKGAAAAGSVTADLDAEVWRMPGPLPSSRGGDDAGAATPAPEGPLLALLDAPGLDLPAAWAAIRPQPPPGDVAQPVLRAIDKLARTLDRGARLALVMNAEGGLSPEAVFASSPRSPAAMHELLATALAAPPPGETPDGPRCISFRGEPVCLAVEERRIRIAPRGALAGGAGDLPPEGRDALLTFSLGPRGGPADLTVKLPSSGGGAGSWILAGAR